MPSVRLLYLTNHQLVAYQWNAGQLKEDASFEVAEAAGNFVTYLQEQKRSLFSLVVNVAEEGFQIDSIPFLQASDRTAIIDRKLGQMFQSAALSVAVSLGFEKSRRKNERMLFAALNNASLFEPWLQALKRAEARLSGIYSLPLLSEAIVARMQLPRERCLLVTVQDTSIRQTYFDRGQLSFSRLSPLGNSSISGTAQAIANEAAKTQQYLLGQRLIARADVLSVHVLAHPGAMQAISTSISGSDTLRFQMHNLHEVAKKLGLKNLPEDSRADLLFAHSAAAAAPKVQFAREPLRKEFRLWQIANGLSAAGVVIFAGCILFVAKELIDILSLRNRADTAMTAASISDQRYRTIAATFPPLPISNDALRQITGKYAELDRQSGGPARFYDELSKALGKAPQIDIDGIEWKLAGGSGGLASTSPPAAARPPAAGGTPVEPTESAVVRGTVQLGSKPNPREILRIFDAFVEGLRLNPQLTVTVQQQPFDTGAEKTLKSSDTGSALILPRPFAITISRKLSA